MRLMVALALIALLTIPVSQGGLCIHPESGMAYWFYKTTLLENGTQIQIIDASLREFYDAPPKNIIWQDIESYAGEKDWL